MIDKDAHKRAFENFTPRQNPVINTALPVDDSDITDPDELRQFTRQELIRVVKRNRGSLGVVPAIRELLDRLDGKPSQAVNLSADLKVVTVNANIAFVPAEGEKVIEGVVDNLQVIENK